MWEKILIRILPKIWESAFKRIEKQNLISMALEQAYKNRIIRSTWKSFVKSVISWLEDALDEARSSLDWDIAN